MIYWLFRDYFSKAGLGFRLAGAAAVAFAIVMLIAPRLIHWLVRKKIGDVPEFDHADLNELTRHKSTTPTMGGILIVIAILASVLLFGNLGNMYVKGGLVALVWLGAVGGWDDWLKLKSAASGGRDGLKTWEKLVHQIGAAVVLSGFVWKYGAQSYYAVPGGAPINPAHSFFWPFPAPAIALSFLAYVIIMVLTMVGSSNAVNLTDGMDGLAAGNLVMVAAVLLVFTWVVGVETWSQYFAMPFVQYSAEMTLICAAMVGASLGFLWYNAHPASVFMGDTGSLPLGGMLGYIAVVIRQELLLLIAGGVFVVEALSVVLQVGYFKWTKRRGGIEGKRLLRCAPVHHHFHLSGWAETKVVIRFWILGLIFAALAMATLKLR
ncbi:MAG: phospho-N-acetylmuramoyl-pentapeptide-transferase [Planctomycetes bacterium]|nr:phospho-N-acetylmuramoyl-pentapeptide-transferase [Planctomycetota bacterium]